VRRRARLESIALRESIAQRAEGAIIMMRLGSTRAGAGLITALLLAVVPMSSASADAPITPPACPDVVIPEAAILPNAVGCWNAIGVQAVRAGVPFQTQGLLYLGYTQAAVYDAVTAIEGRYEPYADVDVPPGVDTARASPEAATAAAAHAMLTSAFLGLPAAAQAGLPSKYMNYITALGGMADRRVADGVAVGQAAAEGLIADRTGDRDESITYTPGPLTAGAWTFAPLPSLQSAQTPWIGVMRPLMLDSPAQFRSDPPPALSRRRWAREFNEVKAYGAVASPVRTPEQTAVARFWNANAVNQSNQGFHDVAAAQGMDLVDSARLLAMGTMVDADTGMACWDSKYTYLFWRPVMAIRNAELDGNPATEPDPGWTPLLTTPNQPEWPSAHTCLTGAESVVYAHVLRTLHIGLTIHGSADGTPNNWAATRTFERVFDLRREIVDARVWAGLHYRGSDVAGLAIGRHVARWTLRRFFQRADRGEDGSPAVSAEHDAAEAEEGPPMP
jgi:hypothetical protein